MKRNSGPSTSLIIFLVCIILGFAAGFLYSNDQSIKNAQQYDDIISGLQTELSQKNEEIRFLNYSNNGLTEQLSDRLEYIIYLNTTLSSVIEEKNSTISELYNLKEKYKSYDEEMNELKWENIILKSRLGERLNWKTYSNHDISFEYPQEMELSIIDEAYDSGTLLNINYFEPTSYLYFSWINLDRFNPKIIVEDLEEEHEEIQFEEKDIIKTEIFGHEAYVYYFAIEIGDGAFHGVMCTWYCQNTNRVFILFQYSNGDPLTSFVNILGTVKCHRTGDVA
jgi:regulator of replication initiation timing